MRHLRLLLASAAGSLGVLALNLYVPSLLNFYWWSDRFPRWQAYMDYIFGLHRHTVGPFTRRPIVTTLMEWSSQGLSINLWWSFLLVQGILLTAAGYALGRLAEKLHGPRTALLSVAVFFLSFTLLFSFITPNDSFDESAQYLFLFLTLWGIYERKSWACAPAFFFALLARESSLLLLPGLWLLDRGQWREKIGHYLWPLGAYALYFFTREAEGDPNRFFYWQKNFASPLLAFETFVSLGLALALPLLLLTWPGVRPEASTRAWRRAFSLTLALNTPVVFVAAYARETRLLALPLIFLWPLTGPWLATILRGLPQAQSAFLPLRFALAFLGLAAVALCYFPSYRFAPGYRYSALAFLALWLASSLVQPRSQAHTREA